MATYMKKFYCRTFHELLRGALVGNLRHLQFLSRAPSMDDYFSGPLEAPHDDSFILGKSVVSFKHYILESNPLWDEITCRLLWVVTSGD